MRHLRHRLHKFFLPSLIVGFGASILFSGNAMAATLALSWVDASNNERGFKVERSTGGAFEVRAKVGADATSYTDRRVRLNRTYCYRIRAYNSVGDSAPSNQLCVKPTKSGTETVILGNTVASGSSGAAAVSGAGSAPVASPAPPPEGAWSDYRTSLTIRSTDDDAIGIMFRYQDHDNYYRFSWDKQRRQSRLEKRENGISTMLAEDAMPYVEGQTYGLRIEAQGTDLTVWIDGEQVFSVADASFSGGGIALYSWYNNGSRFDDVLVEDLATGAVLLWDDFDDGDAKGWTFIDEGTDNGPSRWSVSNGVLLQDRNIGSPESAGRLGTFALYTR